MKLLMIGTTDQNGGRRDEVFRLLDSIGSSQRTQPDLSIRLVLRLQNCASPWPELAAYPFAECSVSPGLQPLSVVRNQLLNVLYASEPMDNDAVLCFPDDDCYYPQELLKYVAELFEADRKLDLFFCRYASVTKDVRSVEMRDLRSPAQLVRKSSSATIFVRANIVTKIGGFDEALGLGTTFNAGEDTDFVVRAYRFSRLIRWTTEPLVYHPDRNPARRARNYIGSAVAICRNVRIVPALWPEACRKLLIGVVMVARRQIRLSDLLFVVRTLCKAVLTEIGRHGRGSPLLRSLNS